MSSRACVILQNFIFPSPFKQPYYHLSCSLQTIKLWSSLVDSQLNLQVPSGRRRDWCYSIDLVRNYRRFSYLWLPVAEFDRFLQHIAQSIKCFSQILHSFCFNPDYFWIRSFRGLINDTYKMDLILIHPPHLITLACIYIASVLKGKETTAWFEELRVDMNVVCMRS